MNKRFFCSWSGGKDSCLALYKAIQKGGLPCALLTMMTEDNIRSRSHGLSIHVLRKQSQALNIPIVVYPTTWSHYQSNFCSALRKFKRQNIDVGVFGDIDIQQHRDWIQSVCVSQDIHAFLPLWGMSRKQLLSEFIKLGFKAIIVSLKQGVLDRSFLGKTLDENMVQHIETKGVDPSGEGGEFHTVVVDGPLFKFKLKFELGQQLLSNGYWFQDIQII